MERLPQANTAFDKFTDPQLATYGQAIADGLGSVAGLALYPTPPVPDTVIAAATLNFVNAMADAADGGKQQTANKDAVKLVLQNMLRADARYVTQIARSTFSSYDNIRSRILISGYVASKIPEPLSSLPQLEIDLVQSMGIGQLNVRLVSQKGARAYIAYYKKATEANFSTFVSVSSRFIIPNLESATVYNVKFVPKGTKATTVTETDVMNFTIL